ncbi:hypothetical protein ASC65_12095 [Brevundimonas sp. Root1279]|nr:hypothetical protein ASC65_12095 [Brevundimonas sp. Root1279]
MLGLLSLFVSSLQDPAADVPANLPPVTVEQPRNGEVVLSCAVSPSGQLADCQVVSETPPGRGFGEAALRSAGRARLSQDSVRESGGRGRVRFTVRFRYDPPEP